MKRLGVLMIVALFGLAIATPASAKPDVDCQLRPNHPACVPTGEEPQDDEPVGMTCIEADAALRNISHVEPTWMPSGSAHQMPGDTSFTVTLTNRQNACVDVMSAEGPWIIDVVTLGSATSVALAVSDSVNPGDACWGGCHGDLEATVSQAECDDADSETCKTLTPYLPASEFDSCGLWNDDNGFADGDPQMAFTATYSGTRKLAESVIIEVTLP